MIIFVASAISVLLLAVICYRVFKDTSVTDERKGWMPPVLLGSAVLSLSADCISGGISAAGIMVDIAPALVGMLVLTSSLWERGFLRIFSFISIGVYVMLAGVHLVMAVGWLRPPGETVLLATCLMFVLIPSVFFMAGVCRRLRDIKTILKTGAMWTNVSLAVEALYLIIFLSISVLYLSLSFMCPYQVGKWMLVFPFLSGMMLAALGVREADDVLFVLWRGQERRIVESMKVTKVETAMDPSGIDDVYQDIYERVVAYFEAEKPFLDNGLTINDLVKVMYSNKLYISRAISQFTGRNFCQFVNYYRVTYSMELFRNNHDLKIHELASGSGFNSDVSYNMAFRLFMGETPGEWCRKERNRRIKVKK